VLKPHRMIADKVSSYADEASAFVRRRRHHRRSFIRIQQRSGDAVEISPEAPDSDRIMDAAGSLISRTP
jgi:hypothetical protein